MLNLKKMIFLTALIAFSFVYLPAEEVAEADNVKVSGILYVFDNLVEYGILEKNKASDLLEKLTQINMRLPKGECEKRILKWRSS